MIERVGLHKKKILFHLDNTYTPTYVVAIGKINELKCDML